MAPLGEPARRAGCARNFRRNEDNAQRNSRLDRRRRHMHVTERGQRECDAVRDGERRDRPHQRADAAHDQHQREHEQQMINTKKNVLDAQPEVTARRRPRSFL